MSTSKPWRIIRTLLVSYLFTIVLLALLTFLLYKFRLPESQITLGINAVYILSCFLGGLLAGKAMKTRRFFWGLLTGLLYFAVLFAVSMLQDQAVTSDMAHILTVLGMCAASGMVGGMVS